MFFVKINLRILCIVLCECEILWRLMVLVMWEDGDRDVLEFVVWIIGKRGI